MQLLVKIKSGYSADLIVIDNVVNYDCVCSDVYMITYEVENTLFDIYIKHVKSVKEVR